MDYFMVAAIISAFVIIVLSVVILRQPKNQDDGSARPRPLDHRERGPGRANAMRNQRARMRANAARNEAAFAEEEENDENGERDVLPPTRNVDFDDKMGAKKKAKLEAKAERRAAREAEEHMREDRKKKEEKLEEERRKREEDEEEEERKREEDARRLEEEKRQREEAEYNAMKTAFTVEGEGFDEEEIERDNLLHEFVNYIKSQKVVQLDDLAAHFKLKTQATIERIASLQASADLTGVVDDRGKFIYISQQELQDVADFIKQRGRVSITELAENSNKLISLNPVTVT